MTALSLSDYWALLRRSWIVITACALLGALVALVFSLLSTPVYQSSAQMFVNVQYRTEAGTTSGGTFVKDRIATYLRIIDSPAVLDPVIKELGLDVSTAQLASRVSAVNPPGTVLIDVIVRGKNPDEVVEVTNAVAKSFANEIPRLEGWDSGTPTPSPTPTSPATKSPAGTSTLQASIIRPAVSAAKVAPRTRTNVLLGGLVGLSAGVGISFLRQALDTTVKSPSQMEKAAEASSLGVVLYDAEASENPLIALRDTPRSEAFRSLRTNLQYVDVDNPPKAIVVTSSMPSEGKTTTACNLAIAIAQAGIRVLLVEADLRRPKVASYLGVDGSRGLTDVLAGRIPLNQSIVKWRRGLLDFVPAGTVPPNPSELLGSKHMASLLVEFRRRYDMIIIDAPPVLPITDATVLATVTDGAILVCRFGVTRRDQLKMAADSLRQVNARILGSVLNFVPANTGGYGYGYGYGYGHTGRRGGALAPVPVGAVPGRPPVPALPPANYQAQPPLQPGGSAPPRRA